MTSNRSTRLRLGTALAMLLAGACGIEGSAGAADSAVILMYHHVDATTPASTSVTPGQFEAHLEHLEREGYRVRPLLEVVTALSSGQAVAEKTVVLTFDDGYRSVLDAAMPMLRSRNWPFTVFVASDYAEGNHRGYLDWDGLRELTANGATIGNHTRSHAHLVRRLDGENEREWRARLRDEIDGATRRLTEELGAAVIPVLAYPFGEYDSGVKTVVADLGLYALGQHSGAAGRVSDFLALPRFPIASGYDDLDDFALRVRSKALPVELVGREDHVVTEPDGRPRLRIRLHAGDYRAEALACFATGQGAMEIEWIGEGFVEALARPRTPLNVGRSKYNCTAPSTTTSGVYYWFSYLWMKKYDDGSWYSE